MKKYRKIIGIASILYIIYLYISKDLINLSGMSISEIMPIIATNVIVTGGKIGILSGIIIGTKKIINKTNKKNNENTNQNINIKKIEEKNNEIDIVTKEFECKKNNDKILEENNFENKNIESEKIKILVKKKKW